MHWLRLKNVSKQFGTHLDVLQIIRRLDMDCEAGKITALIGANGAGKTTLFNLINGFLRPDSGTICCENENGDSIINLVKTPTWKIARLGVGRMFQDVRLFAGMTVLENVLVAFPDQNEENIWQVFARFGQMRRDERQLKEKAESVLDGFGIASRRHSRAGDLSYGEQKLVAFARLIVADAKLLLLDEPTSGINPKMQEKMIDLIKQFAEQKKIIVIIEHQLELVKKIADTAKFMRDGQIIEIGEPEESLSIEELLRISEARKAYVGYGEKTTLKK